MQYVAEAPRDTFDNKAPTRFGSGVFLGEALRSKLPPEDVRRVIDESLSKCSIKRHEMLAGHLGTQKQVSLETALYDASGVLLDFQEELSEIPEDVVVLIEDWTPGGYKSEEDPIDEYDWEPRAS